MIQKTHTGCGCEITVYGDGSANPDITFCDLHDAAEGMLTLLRSALPIIESEAERREVAQPTPEYLAKVSDGERAYHTEMRELAERIEAEIAKATGETR